MTCPKRVRRSPLALRAAVGFGLLVVAAMVAVGCTPAEQSAIEHLDGLTSLRVGCKMDKAQNRETQKLVQEHIKGLIEIGEPAVKPAVRALSSDNECLRTDIVYVLKRIGSPAVPELLKVLDSGDLNARLAALSALGEIGDRRAVPRLQEALLDPDRRVMILSAKTLCQFGDERGFSALFEALESGDPDARLAAVAALRDIGGERVVPALIEALRDSENRVKLTAVEALAELKDPRAVDPIKKYTLRSDYYLLRKGSAKAIYAITGKMVEYHDERGRPTTRLD